MQQVYTTSETDCIYTAQGQLSHTPIPPASTAHPGLAGPSHKDMLLGFMQREKNHLGSSCGKARLSLEEASLQAVLKLRPLKVPDHVSTSVNENSAPTQVSHSATPFQAAVKLLRACPPHKLHEEKKGTQGTPISQHHGPYRPVNHAVCRSNTRARSPSLPLLPLPPGNSR